MRFLRPALVIVIVILADQVLKFWVKLHFQYGETREVFDWFKLSFIENPGMAFGLSWGGESGKLMLTLFRLAAAIAIGYYLIKIVKRNEHPGFIISISLIFVGAVGNILDSVFYGALFDKGIDPFNGIRSYEGIAMLSQPGYSKLFHGNVVDMLYFPIWDGFLPTWVPFWGGDYFIFFRPVFNIADSAITCGVISIILFQKWFFPKNTETEISPAPEAVAENIPSEKNNPTPLS